MMAFFVTIVDSVPMLAKWTIADAPALPGDPKRGETVAAESMVPLSLSALQAWCFVTKNSAALNKRKEMVLFRVPQANEAVRDVILRFQGIIAAPYLKTLGNWDGVPKHAPGASQTLELHAGPYPAVFKAQLSAWNDIRQYVFTSLQEANMFKPIRGKHLNFRRDVFIRVVEGEEHMYTSCVTKQDDPSGTVARLAKWWMCCSRCHLGSIENDVIVPLHELDLRVGDLVDVTATVDISVFKKGGAKKVYVTLNPRRVVRLKSQVDPLLQGSGEAHGDEGGVKTQVAQDDDFAVKVPV